LEDGAGAAQPTPSLLQFDDARARRRAAQAALRRATDGNMAVRYMAVA